MCYDEALVLPSNYAVMDEEEIMLKKNKNSKLKKWIEFWCVCAIIGCISGFTWSDNMVMNIIVIIISALILAIIRVVLIFYSNSRR